MTTSSNFSKHCENLRAVKATLVQIQRAHKNAIRRGDDPATAELSKVHAVFLAIYAEAYLRKISADPAGFNDKERKIIWSERSQQRRWEEAIELSARRHYGVLMHRELHEDLSTGDLERIQQLLKLIKGDLADVIGARNKLGHGQPVHQLRSKREDQFVADSTTLVYNYTSLYARFKIIDSIGRMVNVLAVSEPTFTRDFLEEYSKVKTWQVRLDGAGYDDLVKTLRRKRPDTV